MPVREYSEKEYVRLLEILKRMKTGCSSALDRYIAWECYPTVDFDIPEDLDYRIRALEEHLNGGGCYE